YKLRNGIRKWLFKKAVAGRVSRESREREKKGFGIPVAAWLRDMPLPLRHTHVNMNNNEVLRRWGRHRERRSDERFLLWSWLGLQKAITLGENIPAQLEAAMLPHPSA